VFFILNPNKGGKLSSIIPGVLIIVMKNTVENFCDGIGNWGEDNHHEFNEGG